MPNLPFGDAVRASAAFPGGIPPKRLRLSFTAHPFAGWKEANEVFPWEGPPPPLYLADGGIWNNLGTDWFTDPGLFAIRYHHAMKQRRVDHLFVVDAGAPYRRRRLAMLAVPGLADIVSAFTVAKVQYRSTVWPRIAQLHEATSRALAHQVVALGELQKPVALVRLEEGSWRELVRLPIVDNPTSLKADVDPVRTGEVGSRAKSLHDAYGSGYGINLILRSPNMPAGDHVIGDRIRKGATLGKRSRWDAVAGDLHMINSRVSTTLFRLPPRLIFTLLLQGYLDSRDITYAHFGVKPTGPSITRLASMAGCTVDVHQGAGINEPTEVVVA